MKKEINVIKENEELYIHIESVKEILKLIGESLEELLEEMK